MGTTTNIFLWISRFTTIMSQCRGSLWLQCSQKLLELKFCIFQWLGSNFARGSQILQYLQESTCVTVSYQAAILFKKRLWHRGFLVNIARFLRTPFLRNTSRWLLLFDASCWLYVWQLYKAGNFQVVKS